MKSKRKKRPNKKKNRSEQDKEDSKSQIFVKYKSYENNNEKNNSDYDTHEYDSDENVKKSTLFNRKNKPSIKRRRFRINIKQTNRFTYKGNLNDYKDLEFRNKITKNILKGKTNMSFKDFKNKVN